MLCNDCARPLAEAYCGLCGAVLCWGCFAHHDHGGGDGQDQGKEAVPAEAPPEQEKVEVTA